MQTSITTVAVAFCCSRSPKELAASCTRRITLCRGSSKILALFLASGRRVSLVEAEDDDDSDDELTRGRIMRPYVCLKIYKKRCSRFKSFAPKKENKNRFSQGKKMRVRKKKNDTKKTHLPVSCCGNSSFGVCRYLLCSIDM